MPFNGSFKVPEGTLVKPGVLAGQQLKVHQFADGASLRGAVLGNVSVDPCVNQVSPDLR